MVSAQCVCRLMVGLSLMQLSFGWTKMLSFMAFVTLQAKNIDYGLGMKIKDHQSQKTLSNMKRTFSPYSFCYKAEGIIYGFDILFNPLVLTKNRVYTITAYVYGQEPCYGCDGVSTVECSGVTFRFILLF